jgi:Domain of unknown function (DUF4145)
MNRSIWKARLSKNYCPAWPCPVCETGTMRLIKDGLNERETARSISNRLSDDWEPDWVHYIFSAHAKCTNAKCSQNFVISGRGNLEQIFDDNNGYEFEDTFSPLAIFPMPNIIKIPKKCPKDVRSDLVESFELFFAHQSSSANAIRYALEKLMTHQGISSQQPSSKSKSGLADLTLHQRIEIFTKSEPAIGQQLMALKWLGNSGSHGSPVNVEDLLDAFEILEHSLDEIIENKSKKIAALAQKLTQKHK